MALFSVRTPEPADELSREQVLSILKAAGDAELRRHIPELKTDGCGSIGFICCGRSFTRDEWWTHVNNWLKQSTTVKPKK